jgi:hypothetical protein
MPAPRPPKDDDEGFTEWPAAVSPSLTAHLWRQQHPGIDSYRLGHPENQQGSR